MHAINYRITLPADYDMRVVRERVATRGHLLDGYPGLALKAYLMRERGTDGSPVNQYAPFYLWNTAHGMNGFLWGPGFQGVVSDFGRPVVEHWTVLGFEPGPSVADVPRAAARRAWRLDPALDPGPALEAAVAELAGLAAQPSVHSVALVVDPRHWELLRFTLWRQEAPEEQGTERYQVLHLSRPELDTVSPGRQW